VRVLLAGGGTGGHIAPALAVAEAVKAADPSVEVHFAATTRPVDRSMYASWGGSVTFMRAPRVDCGWTGRSLLPFSAALAVGRALSLLAESRPAAILATGGYSSFYCALAGRLRGTPVLLHESNAIPGRANRVASRFASRVLVGFECAAACFGGRALFVGNPVRPSLRRMDRRAARIALGLSPELPTVLVLGGSQGARALNDLALLAPPGLQVVLQCGERDAARMSSSARERSGVLPVPFAVDPSPLYSCADLAIARAGAMTLAELSHFALPAVLIPYPFAADDHQSMNAAAAAATGGALSLKESVLSADGLWTAVREVLSEPERLASMSRAISGLFPGGSAGIVAGLLLDAARGGASR